MVTWARIPGGPRGIAPAKMFPLAPPPEIYNFLVMWDRSPLTHIDVKNISPPQKC